MTSRLLPSPTPRRRPTPASARAKASAWFTPPLAATTATGPGSRSAAPGTKLAVSRRWGARKPEVFGPRTRMPVSRTTSASACWYSAPSPPASANPPAHTRAARAPAAAASRRASAVTAAGMQETTRSGVMPWAAAASPTVGKKPRSGSGRPVLTFITGPGNEPRESVIAAPSFPGVADAPSTAMARGANSGSRAVTWCLRRGRPGRTAGAWSRCRRRTRR